MQYDVGRQLLVVIAFTHTNLGNMLQDIIEEAKKWDLLSLAASLWWTSTYEGEEKTDMNVTTNGGVFKFPFEENFKILGCVMNRRGTTLDANEERMQSVNKAFWKDFKIHNNKDCLMENLVQTSSGSCLPRILLRE